MQSRQLCESTRPRFICSFIQPISLQNIPNSRVNSIAVGLNNSTIHLERSLATTRAISMAIHRGATPEQQPTSTLDSQSLSSHTNTDQNNTLETDKETNYEQQQMAYVAKIRQQITPKPLSEELKEFDSTENNPTHSVSARFGLKPDAQHYQFRLIAWGEAGAGIPLINNPYSVRPQEAPAVDPNLKRKKFTTEQRDAVRHAPYRQAVQTILNASLHNSHAVASRFLGPESNANIAPASYTNNKNKHWGQGEMQSHLEHALYRLESKASNHHIHLFLRSTDYLGGLGELYSRKIKVFLSEPVTDRSDLAHKGNVKEIVLGTFYLPGLINEHHESAIVRQFKQQVIQLEESLDKVIANQRRPKQRQHPLEVHYKYGICAQELRPLAHQKLLYGKQHRTNDGLRPVLQHMLPSLSNTNTPSRQPDAYQGLKSDKKNNLRLQINQLLANPDVLRSGEELWNMNEIETALEHIRNPNIQRQIQQAIETDTLSWQHASVTTTQGLSRSYSDSSLDSLSTLSSNDDLEQTAFELEFEDDEQAEHLSQPTSSESNSWVDVKSNTSRQSKTTYSSSVESQTEKTRPQPAWAQPVPRKKRYFN